MEPRVQGRADRLDAAFTTPCPIPRMSEGADGLSWRERVAGEWRGCWSLLAAFSGCWLRKRGSH